MSLIWQAILLIIGGTIIGSVVLTGFLELCIRLQTRHRRLKGIESTPAPTGSEFAEPLMQQMVREGRTASRFEFDGRVLSVEMRDIAPRQKVTL